MRSPSESTDEVARLREEVAFWKSEKERHRERVRELSLQVYRLQTNKQGENTMKVRISKTFDFDAAHRLPNVPEGHKCGRMHGHTYRVEVMLEGEPDHRGFVVDYAEIAEAWKPIEHVLDHHTLNDVPGLENPTTEILAPWILERFSRSLPETVGVRVFESSTTYCEVWR